MPRIDVPNTGGWTENVDYCRPHFPRNQKLAEAQWGRDCEYDCEHPPYDDPFYVCEKCGKRLTDSDK